MTGGGEDWQLLLDGFLIVFSEPSAELFVRLITGWVLCPGRRTVTRIYRLADPRRSKAHDAYHRFLREGVWLMSRLWELAARLYVNALFPTGTIPLDLDDTTFHKTGRRIAGAAWWRDAVRSTGTRLVHCLGLNVVVLTLRVDPPWRGEPLGLPVNLRLHRKNGPTLLDLAQEMVEEFAGWFPDRAIRLCADGFYASLAGRKLPRTYLCSRMRCDAALYAPAPKRGKHQRGRPRKKGRRLPTPEVMAKTRKGWRRITVNIRGKTQERLVLERDVLWFEVCPDRLMRLVISRDPEGKEHDDFLFTTERQATAELVVPSYGGRWCIEDTFRNVKQCLGGEDPQSWKGQGPERAAALSFWIYSAVWFWYLRTHGATVSWSRLPWYPQKRTASFADAIASLRRVLWRNRLFSKSGQTTLPRKMVDDLLNVLAVAA